MAATVFAWVVAILLGALAGWLAARIMGNSTQGFLMNILFGIGGSVVGGWVAGLFGFENNALLWQLALAVLGAVILIVVKGLLFGRRVA